MQSLLSLFFGFGLDDRERRTLDDYDSMTFPSICTNNGRCSFLWLCLCGLMSPLCLVYLANPVTGVGRCFHGSDTILLYSHCHTVIQLTNDSLTHMFTQDSHPNKGSEAALGIGIGMGEAGFPPGTSGGQRHFASHRFSERAKNGGWLVGWFRGKVATSQVQTEAKKNLRSRIRATIILSSTLRILVFRGYAALRFLQM